MVTLSYKLCIPLQKSSNDPTGSRIIAWKADYEVDCGIIEEIILTSTNEKETTFVYWTFNVAEEEKIVSKSEKKIGGSEMNPQIPLS